MPGKNGIDSLPAHDSAVSHVSGEAIFINDMEEGSNMLFGHIVGSPYASARILSVDTADAMKVPGIIAILTAKDIPGENQLGPVVKDEVCLAVDNTEFIGQAIALTTAESHEAAFEAEQK